MPEFRKFYDGIIIGGGIAGSAMAAVLARSGRDILVLEQSEVFSDRVRGEIMVPWGVKEAQTLELYQTLISAGGHHVPVGINYDEVFAPEAFESAPTPMSQFVPGVPGPLCLGHPQHCQALLDAAVRLGALAVRGAAVEKITLGSSPSVTFRTGDHSTTVGAGLIIGADGRNSMVREQASISITQDRPRNEIGGVLVDSVDGWNPGVLSLGAQDDFHFFIFPQGGGRFRVYGCWSLSQRRRFAGPEAGPAFLSAFRMSCCPTALNIAEGRAAGPLLSYINNESHVEEPTGEGVVLIGDAAGWTDPLIGCGLASTYRDVRVVSDILLAS